MIKILYIRRLYTLIPTYVGRYLCTNIVYLKENIEKLNYKNKNCGTYVKIILESPISKFKMQLSIMYFPNRKMFSNVEVIQLQQI